MNRSTRTIAQILGILLLTAVLSLFAYYIGSSLGKSIIIGTPIAHNDWQAHYKKLVYATGATGGIISLLWYSLARFGMKIHTSYGVGKRTLWGALGGLMLIACVALPYAFANADATLKMSASIPLLFVALYAVIGYWIGSLFMTPAAYKYTPLGAEKIRASWGRK